MIVRHRGLALVLMLAAALAACSEEKNAGGPGGPGGGAPLQVGFVTLKPEPVPLTVDVAGRTAAFAVADIRPRVDGIVRRRVFTEGAEVKAGDLLYEIDPRTYQAAYDAAEAALEKANGALPSAQAKVDRYNQLVGANSVTPRRRWRRRRRMSQRRKPRSRRPASISTSRRSRPRSPAASAPRRSPKARSSPPTRRRRSPPSARSTRSMLISPIPPPISCASGPCARAASCRSTARPPSS